MAGRAVLSHLPRRVDRCSTATCGWDRRFRGGGGKKPERKWKSLEIFVGLRFPTSPPQSVVLDSRKCHENDQCLFGLVLLTPPALWISGLRGRAGSEISCSDGCWQQWVSGDLTIKTPAGRCDFKSMIELVPGAKAEAGDEEKKHWQISDDSQSEKEPDR